MRVASSRKGMSIGVVIGLVIFIAVGLIALLLYFAGSGLFPRITNELVRFGIIDTNLSVEEPPLFDISPSVIEERRRDVLGRGFRYDVAFAGAFEVSRDWSSLGFTRARYFWIEERFDEGITPTGERELIPRLEHITHEREGLTESDIWGIGEITRGRIRLTYQSDDGIRTIEASLRPSEDETTRTMLTIPYTTATGETISIDIAELRYLGLSENERRIYYEIVPSYSQESIERDAPR